MGADAATGSLGKRFFLHHVPKTGGSTVIHAVYESFGANNWRYFFASDGQKFDWAPSLIDRFDTFADISKVNDYLYSQGLAEIGGSGYHNRISEPNKVLTSLDTVTRLRLQSLNSVDYCIYRIAMGEDRTQF